MIENITLPLEVLNALNGESKDFVIKATYTKSAKQSLILIIASAFGVFLQIFIFFFIFLPLLYGKQISSIEIIPINNVENLSPPIPSYLLFIITVVGAIGVFVYHLYNFYKPGGIFIGTKAKLVQYQSGKVIINTWDKFTGKIELVKFLQKNELWLELKKFNYSHEQVYICGINNAAEIQKICQQRITENNKNS